MSNGRKLEHPYKVKLRMLWRKSKDFGRHFLRNRKGVTGVVILVFYILVALLAPYLTPYDPVYSKYVAGPRAKPLWFRYLPGLHHLSMNLEPVEDPSFKAKPKGIKVEVQPQGFPIELRHSEDVGYPRGSGPGSLLLLISGSENTPNEVKVRIYVRFHYPYNGSPARFTARVALFDESSNKAYIKARVFLEDAYGKEYTLSLLSLRNGSWAIPQPPIDSYQAALRVKLFMSVLKDPASIIFSRSGDYTYGVELSIKGLRKGSTVKVYVDDFYIRLYGTCFGLLGTDAYGRDLFSQFLYGARVSLLVGLLSAIFSVAVGLVVGLISGYIGGLVDELLMRFTDMLLVLPTLPLLLVLTAVLGASIWNLIFLIGFLGWMGFARVIRSQVLSLKERAFVEAAKAIGAGTAIIIVRHILPNVASLAYVALALSVPSAIVSEAALSWLGLYDPNVMSWGRMLHDVQYYGAITDWWWVVPPGLSIALLSMSFIFIGYAIDELLNPRLRARR